MGDEIKVIEVEHTVEVSLSLHVGGSFPYKSRLFEYPAAGGDPKPLEGERTGAARVSIGKVAKGVVRRFAWSVVIVSDDDLEQTVDVTGHVHVASKTVGIVKGELPVKEPLQKAFVNVHVKGKGA
jgi:hypothetical protein